MNIKFTRGYYINNIKLKKIYFNMGLLNQTSGYLKIERIPYTDIITL